MLPETNKWYEYLVNNRSSQWREAKRCILIENSTCYRLDVAYLLGRDALAASVLLGQTVADKQSGKDKLGIVHKMCAANSYKWF